MYTNRELGVKAAKGDGKLKIHLNRIFVSGFFECKKGLYVVTVAVGQSNFANHCIVFDGWRNLIIDPNYDVPICFDVLYTDGKPDAKKWNNMFKVLDYKFFDKMHQVYSIDSRFCVQDSRLQTERTPEVKRCKFFKKGACRNGDLCTFGHSTMELVPRGTPQQQQHFFFNLAFDILERIIGVQMR